MVRYSRFLYKLVIKVKGRKIGRIENVTPIHQILLVRREVVVVADCNFVKTLTYGKKISLILAI